MNSKVLYEALMKQEDGKCDMETALVCVESWQIFSKPVSFWY